MGAAAIELPGGACPVPLSRYERVVLGHGGGGRLTQELVRRIFLPAFGEDPDAPEEDAAVRALDPAAGRLAITTDAFVVSPLFFPGGDIGSLAVHGAVNDLAMVGARPRWLTAAFILEEGFPLADLERIARSMGRAARAAGVEIVAGDTKVVERGKGDGCAISVTGIGVVPEGRALSPASVRPGDRVLVSGTLGDHGAAILAARQGIELESPLVSDAAPLAGLADALLRAAPGTRCMRDPTRGGLASALCEIAAASGLSFAIDEAAVPVRGTVRGICELLGLDPLYVASEGKLAAIVPAEEAAAALAALRAHPLGAEAAILGCAEGGRAGTVAVRTLVGGRRALPMLSGEQLPRIC